MNTQLGQKNDLSEIFDKTDKTLGMIKWRQFSTEKIFSTKLRFQIKLDDFREAASKSSTNDTTIDVTDQDVLGFYNLASENLLGALESDIGNAQVHTKTKKINLDQNPHFEGFF